MKSNSVATASGVGTCSDKISLQLYKLIDDLRDRPRLSKEVDYDIALKLWAQQCPVYSELADLAEDLIACTASQTYVECVFLVCGKLSAGRRNHTTNRKCVSA